MAYHRYQKHLGQHFLQDASLCTGIVAAAGNIKNCDVLEIGPGGGILTAAILAQPVHHLYAVEKDRATAPLLKPFKKDPRFTLIFGDALHIPMPVSADTPLVIIANLPYNVGTALLLQWLHGLASGLCTISHMTLMFQREVGLRIVAKPCTADYGRLSVLCQYLCDCTLIFEVPSHAFVPPPKVDSLVVHIRPRPPVDAVSLAGLEALTKMAFSARRKMLHNTLKDYHLPWDTLGIASNARAEELSVADYCRIVRYLTHQSS